MSAVEPIHIEIIEKKRFEKILKRNILLPLGVGFLTIAFFLAIVWYLLALNRWVENTDAVIRESNNLVRLIVDQETGLRGFLLTGQQSFLAPYTQSSAVTGIAAQRLREQVRDSEPQQKRIDSIAATYDSWRGYAEEAIALKRTGAEVEKVVSSGRGKQLIDEIRRVSVEFIAEEENIKRARNEQAKTLVIALCGGFFAVSLLLSGLLAQLGRRQLLTLSSTYESVLDTQLLQTEALQQQAWLRAGQTRLGDQIIGQLPLPILCQNILGFLAEHLGIVVGALYIGQDEEVFRRVANYGFSKEMALREQSFAIREGLVGQVAATRQLLRLAAVPADYVKVNSGLGESLPSSIVIVPIVSDNTAIAVIELGFFRAVEERDIELLELVSENIGAAISAANYRRRLHDALLEMQQLNDELQAQQEELRAANEELEEQAQALEESQLRLESQQAELEQTNELLEDQHETLRENNDALHKARGLLEERALQLEQASRYKSEFLANMSHELRTPLNSALILSKLLADNGGGNLTEEQVKFAHSIYDAGNDLLALINDVLDIAKVEAGKLDILPDDLHLARLVDALNATFQPLAAERLLGFDIVVADNVPRTLYTDRQRLDQILRNLLSNAIKFTERGAVRLEISRHSTDRLAFAVIDSGIGIDASQQRLIFAPFHQVDGATNRRYGGTGLGLSISQNLAGLLGGELGVSSTPGSGSVFTLLLPDRYRTPSFTALPLASAERREPTPAPVRPLKIDMQRFDDDRDSLREQAQTILIIEDEIQFAHILYDLAHELQYQCLVATSAEEGFELALRHAPKAILLDMKLPDQSGLSVLSRLKDEPKTRHIPVHVISVEERTEAALQMGAIGYATKPVSREQLRALFDKLEARLTQKMKQVLIVEQLGQHGTSTAKLIADVDVEAVSVALGEQALALLKERRFDCMIIDLDLPDMDGSELLRRMAEEVDGSGAFPPVIVHSSRNLTREEEQTLLRYSRSIIIKGVRSPERLLDEVTLFLHKVEADLSVERQRMLREARSRDRAFEGRKILVVDDDVRNIFALTSALERKGAAIEVGRNGLEALSKLEETADIDLVLMDIMMPEMDGYEAIEAIRANPRFAKLPIIAVTAKAMRDDQERCLRVGANDYVAKPVDLDRLISLIRVWMPQVQRV